MAAPQRPALFAARPRSIDECRQAEAVWTFHTGDLPSNNTKNTYGAENTPLKVGDTLYVCTPKNILIAARPGTGKQRWRLRPARSRTNHSVYRRLPWRDLLRRAQCRPRPRPAPRRIIEGTLDARLIAVDAKTGQPCASFGTWRPGRHQRRHGPARPGHVLDHLGADHRARRRRHRPPGAGRAEARRAVRRDPGLRCGDRRAAMGLGHGQARSHRHAAAGADLYPRHAEHVDDGLRRRAAGPVYVPLGNIGGRLLEQQPLPTREKEFTTSLVALDVTTGKPAWHFQTVHNDVWDYDLGSQATLVDFPTDSGRFPRWCCRASRATSTCSTAARASRWSGVEERPVPQGGVEPNSAPRPSPSRSITRCASPI